MKRHLLLLIAIVAMTGCARFSTKQTDLSYDPTTGKPLRQITTRAASYTLASANSKLAQWKATQTDKTQGATVGGLEQASSGTNVAATLGAMADLLRALGAAGK